MKLCHEDCIPVCDFCKHYIDDGEGSNTFEAEGLCVVKNKRVDASESCQDDFECFRT